MSFSWSWQQNSSDAFLKRLLIIAIRSSSLIGCILHIAHLLLPFTETHSTKCPESFHGKFVYLQVNVPDLHSIHPCPSVS